MAQANASNEMKTFDKMTVQAKNGEKSNNAGAVAEEKTKTAQEVMDDSVRERETKNGKKNYKGKGIKKGKEPKNVSAAIDDERSNAIPGTSSHPQAEDHAKNEKNKKGKTPKYGKYPKKEKNKNSTSSVVEEDKPNPKQEMQAQKYEGKERVSKKSSLINDIEKIMDDAINSILSEITADFKDFHITQKDATFLYVHMHHEINTRLKAFGWTKLGKMNCKEMVAAYRTYHNKAEDIEFLVDTFYDIKSAASAPALTDAELDVVNANAVDQAAYNREPSYFGGPSCSGVSKIWKGKGDD